MAKGNTHTWRFFRAGGFDQVLLETGADLTHLGQLDQKLWVALGCPTAGLECDTKTLQLMDADKDGRVRVPEILAAVNWTAGLLKNPDDLVKGAPSLPLNAINDASADGQQVLASARQILADLGKSDATAISVADTSDTVKIFAQTLFNGDGIVPPEAAQDPAVKAVIGEIIGCLGGETDRSGKPGVSQAKADQFFAELQAFVDWHGQAAAEPDKTLPLGEGTTAGHAAYQAVKAKVDDYFARCRLAAFDGRAIAALNRQESEYLELAAKDLSISAAEVAHFPLAAVKPGQPLSLKEGLNPAWVGPIAAFAAAVANPLLKNPTTLSEADWAKVSAAFGPYEAWLSKKTGATVEKLGPARAHEILSGKAKAALQELIGKDKALEPQANTIAAVDKLVRYHRDLIGLLNNFVAFRDFYSKRARAVFEAGTLYLDGRSCDLCIQVADLAKHGAMAGQSFCYLAYCDCTRKSTGEKMTIAAAFTDGDSDFLMPGRNGIFYDRQGRDWDATIVKLVDNPISIRQAFWAPYKAVARLVEEQIGKAAAARSKAVTDKTAAGVAEAAKQAEVAKPAPAPAFDIAKFAGVFAAIGLALGALGAALAAAAQGFFGLSAWQMPLAIAGALLLISGPSMLLAYMKLRKRNLAPILDANGWAINTRAKINVPFGKSLTAIAKLPPGSRRSARDAFAQRRSLKPYLLILLVIAYIVLGKSYENGWLHSWTKGRIGRPAPVQTIPPAPAEPAPDSPAPGPASAPQ